MPNQIDAGVDMIYGKPPEPRSIKGYRPFIIDAVHEVPFFEDDDRTLPFNERLQRRQVFRRENPLLRGVDRVKYALLLAHSLKEKYPVDSQNLTILDDDPALDAFYVPGACWDPYGKRPRPRFDRGRRDVVEEDARFRSSLGGDTLLK